MVIYSQRAPLYTPLPDNWRALLYGLVAVAAISRGSRMTLTKQLFQTSTPVAQAVAHPTRTPLNLFINR